MCVWKYLEWDATYPLHPCEFLWLNIPCRGEKNIYCPEQKDICTLNPRKAFLTSSRWQVESNGVATENVEQ